MTVEESKEALLKLNQEYMKHSAKERLELYDEYRENRAKIQEQLKQGQKSKTKVK